MDCKNADIRYKQQFRMLKYHSNMRSMKNTIYINNEEIKDVVIVCDKNGFSRFKTNVNTIENLDNIFENMLRKTHNERIHLQKVHKHLSDKTKKFYDMLEKGSKFYQSHMYINALALFSTVVHIYDTDEYPDEFNLSKNEIISVKYALALCNFAVNQHGSLLTAIDILQNLISKYKKFPCFYLTLSKIHLVLRQYDQGKIIIEQGLNVIEICKSLVELHWPATNILISDSDISTLKQKMKDVAKECNFIHLPDAKCYYQLCLTVGIKNKAIYFDSPDFIGYVSIRCSKDCHFTYHPECWKAYKKSLIHISLSKKILNTSCSTPECKGVISRIIIYDSNRIIKSDAKLDIEEKQISVNHAELFKPPIRQVAKKQDDVKTNLFANSENILKPEAPEFVPSSLTNLNNVQESGDNIHIKTSILKADVPEFQPRTLSVEENSDMHKGGDWSTNSYDSSFASISESDFEGKISCQEFVPLASKIVQPDVNNTDDVQEYCIDPSWTSCIGTPPIVTTLQQETRKRTVITIKPEMKSIGLQTEKTIENHPVSTQCSMEIKDVGIQTVDDVLISQLQDENSKYVSQLRTLNKTLLCERQILTQATCNHKQEVEELVAKIDKLEKENAKLMQATKNEDETLKQKFGLQHNLLLEQMHYNQKLHASVYFAFKDKCTNILWSLSDLNQIANDQTMPSKMEITNCLNQWNQALSAATNNHNFIMAKYDQYFKALVTNDLLEVLSTKILPDIPIEPFSVITQYFKPIFMSSLKLEKQISCQNYVLYNVWQNKLDATIENTVPGKYEMCPPSLPNHSDSSSVFDADYNVSSYENAKRTFQNERNDSSIENKENTHVCKINKITIRPVNIIERNESSLENKDCIQLSENKRAYEQKVHFVSLSSTEQNQDKETEEKSQCFNLSKETNNKNENRLADNTFRIKDCEGATCQNYICNNKSVSVSHTTGSSEKLKYVSQNSTTHSSVDHCVALLKNMQSCTSTPLATSINCTKNIRKTEMDVHERNGSDFSEVMTRMSPPPTKSTEIKGAHKIITALQKHLPNVSVDKLVDSVTMLRQRQGKLSGMSMKDIVLEVRAILYTNQHKNNDDQKLNIGKSPWAKIDDGQVKWHKEQSEESCSICFDNLDKNSKGYRTLRCQHSFHEQCIRAWLVTNSICPICRLFTRLDDEFPPLM